MSWRWPSKSQTWSSLTGRPQQKSCPAGADGALGFFKFLPWREKLPGDWMRTFGARATSPSTSPWRCGEAARGWSMLETTWCSIPCATWSRYEPTRNYWDLWDGSRWSDPTGSGWRGTVKNGLEATWSNDEGEVNEYYDYVSVMPVTSDIFNFLVWQPT